jgi:hypothetical protein
MRDRRVGGDSADSAAGDHAAPAAPGRISRVQAEAAGHHGRGVPGGNLNVDIDKLNHHPGIDSARLGHPDRADHNSYRTVRAAALYDNTGAPSPTVVPAGSPVAINAGAVTKLTCHGFEPTRGPVDCVFVFGYWQIGDKGKQTYVGSGGWMQASALPRVVDTEQRGLASRISHERGDAHHEFGAPITILPKSGNDAVADGITGLYTYPPPYQVHRENLAIYYYANLSLNLPRTGGKRFGVETDRIPLDGPASYREFHPQTPRQEVTIPLFAQGAKHPSGKTLTFVYGYVVNDAGSKIHGWINRLMLAA